MFRGLQVMSQNARYATFFFQLADLGSTLKHAQLREGANNLLQLVPADAYTVNSLQMLFSRYKKNDVSQNSLCNDQNISVDSLFFSASPSQVLYNLKVKRVFRE